LAKIDSSPNLLDIWTRRGAEVVGQTLENPEYQSAAREANKAYRHWHKIQFIARDSGLDPELLWLTIKLGRSFRNQHLPFTSNQGEPLQYTVPDLVQRELMLVDQQLAGRLALDGEERIPADLSDRYIVSSLMEEAIASSQLEGASTVHRVAKDMLRRGRDPRNRDERMILNNYRAIQWIREHKHEPLTPLTLIEMQRMLTEGTLENPDECGRFRLVSEPVVVEDPYGEVLHEPPHASTLSPRLEKLCAFANEDARHAEPFIHPVLRACVLHFQLAYDHPFCDGNGRTARLLFYWLMHRSGYWMFEYLPLSRLILRGPAKYQLAFEYVETDEFDLTYFLVYSARLISMARGELTEYLTRKRKDTLEARRVFAQENMNDRQRVFLLESTERPDHEWTIEIYQAIYGIAYGTARSDLLHLETMGYLRRQQVGNKYVFTTCDPSPKH